MLRNNIAKCATFRRDIAHLEAERGVLASSGTNAVELTRNAARISGIKRQIARRVGFVNQDEAFQRDLAAFASLDEYLKTKIHGCQVHVHFHHDGKTLPVDIDDLKRSRVRPIQVFEVSKDPIKNAVATDP